MTSPRAAWPRKSGNGLREQAVEALTDLARREAGGNFFVRGEGFCAELLRYRVGEDGLAIFDKYLKPRPIAHGRKSPSPRRAGVTSLRLATLMPWRASA
jgi:hypothetical protein